MRINDLTYAINGAAMEVHKKLGPGLLESAYEACLCHELHLRGIPFQRQVPLPLVYKDVKLDCAYRLDLLVANCVVIEIKSVDAIAPIHVTQLLTYLQLGNYRVGLLINFNVESLKDGIVRKVNGFDDNFEIHY